MHGGDRAVARCRPWRKLGRRGGAPVRGPPSPNTWRNYATALRAWLEFVAGRGVDPLGEREALRAVLGAYAGYRLSGPLAARWGASTWNLHMAVLASFYQWAVEEGYC